jgi:hypothetical protein
LTRYGLCGEGDLPRERIINAVVIAGIEVLEFDASEGKKKVNVGHTKKVKFVDRLKAREIMLRLKKKGGKSAIYL